MISLKSCQCPECGVGLLEWNPYEFFKCSVCGGEYWPKEKKVPRTTARSTDKAYVSLSLQPGTKIIGGGSKTGKRKKKKPKRSDMAFYQT